MPKVRASVTVFVGNSLRQEGEVFEYDGPPSPHLVPLEAPVATPPPSPPEASPKPKAPDPTKPWRKINGES